MSTQPSRFHPIRRVVTGHDKNNVAKVIMDGPATNHKGGASGAQSTLMWITEGAPAEMPIGENAEDLGARILGTPPPVNGTRFAVITFPPGNPGRMHRTETIDYVIVMEGELDMDMDELDGEAQSRRHPGAARHQPFMGQPRRQGRARGIRADRRSSARHRPPGAARAERHQLVE